MPSTLPNQLQQIENASDKDIMDERKKSDDEEVTAMQTAAASTPVDSLELGCDDEGLIVIQSDGKQTEDDMASASKESKSVTRTK